MLHLYYSWVNSIIGYGIIIWGGDYIENINPVVKLQNKMVKMLSCINHTPTIDHYQKLNILPICYFFFFKAILHFVTKENYSETRNINYNLRKKNLYLVPKSKKEILHKTIFYLSPRFYNSLPDYLISEKSPLKFKKMLKMYIIGINSIENYF